MLVTHLLKLCSLRLSFRSMGFETLSRHINKFSAIWNMGLQYETSVFSIDFFF